jgi:hypothetical protein
MALIIEVDDATLLRTLGLVQSESRRLCLFGRSEADGLHHSSRLAIPARTFGRNAGHA